MQMDETKRPIYIHAGYDINSVGHFQSERVTIPWPSSTPHRFDGEVSATMGLYVDDREFPQGPLIHFKHFV
jgi:hypothetical protein